MSKADRAYNITVITRSALGLTQAEFARRLDVALVTVARWESGKQRPSHLLEKKIRRLAQRNDIELPPRCEIPRILR